MKLVAKMHLTSNTGNFEAGLNTIGSMYKHKGFSRHGGIKINDIKRRHLQLEKGKMQKNKERLLQVKVVLGSKLAKKLKAFH